MSQLRISGLGLIKWEIDITNLANLYQYVSFIQSFTISYSAYTVNWSLASNLTFVYHIFKCTKNTNNNNCGLLAANRQNVNLILSNNFSFLKNTANLQLQENPTLFASWLRLIQHKPLCRLPELTPVIQLYTNKPRHNNNYLIAKQSPIHWV